MPWRISEDDFNALLPPGGAVICHGPWTVIEAGAARGRRIASWPSLRTDLHNAGAVWVDEEVVADGIPAFNREMLALFSRALGQARPAA